MQSTWHAARNWEPRSLPVSRWEFTDHSGLLHGGPLVRVRVLLHQIGQEIPADKHGAHAPSFVQSMHAIAVWIDPAAGRTVDRNADRLQKNPVGRAGGHGRNDWHAGKVFGYQLLSRSDDPGI